MKKLTLLVVVIATLFSCAEQDKSAFTINGKISGDAEGLDVYVEYADVFPTVYFDTLKIKNGKFKIEGKTDYPRYVHILINRDRSKFDAWAESVTSTKIFVSSGETVSMEGDIVTIPNRYQHSKEQKANVKISGGADQLLLVQYQNEAKQLNEEKSSAWEAYAKCYFEEGNLEAGKEAALFYNGKSSALRDFNLNFMKLNPTSAVSMLIATSDIMSSDGNMDGATIENYLSIIPAFSNSEPMAFVKREVEKFNKTVVGGKYVDFELTTTDGKTKKLSELLDTTKVVLVEFWASWCSPCRAEIPHLKDSYTKYAKQGFDIISVSIDEKNEDWLKAVEQEKMSWGQYTLPRSSAEEIIALYNIVGVPASLLIGKDGAIIKKNSRGAFLDITLDSLSLKE